LSPGALAHEAIVLFSSAVNSVFASPTRCKSDMIANARMLEVIATPRPQPIFSPTYRFEKLMIAPRSIPSTIERTVSCGSVSPR
jgi:hypothetical protein